MSKVTL